MCKARLRKLQGQQSLSSWVFSWDAVGVVKVPWCSGVGPCPTGSRSLLLLLPLQREGSSEHPGKPQALLWGPFFDAACGHVIWAIPVGSLELFGHQQPLGEQQQMLCTSFLP